MRFSDNGDGTGRATAYSFLPVDSNPVSMAANNANQLIVCSGGQLWLFPLAPGSIVYHNVPTAITNIQIVDGASNQDYFVTCANNSSIFGRDNNQTLIPSVRCHFWTT